MTNQIIPLDSAYLFQGGRKLLNFCSRDYLGIAHHPDLKKRAMKCLLEHGIAEAESFFPGGKLGVQHQIEDKIAQLMGKEYAALFPSVFELHMRLIPELTAQGKWDIFVCASANPLLLDAALATTATVHVYETLEDLQLQLQMGEKKLVVTESILWKTGECVDLAALSDLGRQMDAVLYVDHSHELGFSTVTKGIDVIVGALIAGAYAACDEPLKGVSLNPGVLGAVDGALDLVAQTEGEPGQIEQRAYRFRKYLVELGLDTHSNSHLVPIVFGSDEEAQEICELLYHHQIVALPEENRVHFLINIHHTPDQLQQVAEILRAPAMQSFTEAP
jgi:8-amino-7-oxononanoate synthase